MKKTLALIMALVMLVSVAPATAYAAQDNEAYYQDMLLRGLADKDYTKKTKKYDGYHFKVGTQAVWKCTLYTLTATVTKVKGNIATFKVTFDTNIPYQYLQTTGWNDYEVKAVTNKGSKSYRPSEKSSMTFKVDTSKSDGLAFTSKSGMQFVEIIVSKNERNSVFVYSDNPYEAAIEEFANSSDRRSVYPGGGYFNEFEIYDTWALGYYTKSKYKLNKNSYSVTKKSITLGTYAFKSTIKYRKKGAKKWKQKSFGKNKKIVLKGLKANTTYQIQPLCKIYYTDPETNKKMYVLDTAGSTFTLTTVINKKPQIKSVKVSNIKYGKTTIDGYWETDGDWHPTETFNTAYYTIKVKVKNVPKKAKGLRLKLGGAYYYAKGNKKTYTIKVGSRARKKIKGKKVSAQFAWASNTINKSPVGISPSKTVKFKIKKGTTKY